MENPWAGEVALVIDGERRVMRLTLGALAALEEALDAGGLVALAERFESGSFSARDVLAVIVAGLRGGGWQGRTAEIAAADIEGGPMAAARAAALLIARAFTPPPGAGEAARAD